MKHRQQRTPKVPLRDRVDPATFDITEIMVDACILTFALRARMPQVLAVLPVVWGIAWYLRYDDEAPRSPTEDAAATAGRSEVELQQVQSLSDEEFDALLDEVERQGQLPACEAQIPQRLAALDNDAFEQLVREAVDDLPDFVLRELESENIAVTVSDAGHKFGAYGLYVGGSLAYDGWASQILIFRDTLTRDFGADRDELRDQVIRVVRHEGRPPPRRGRAPRPRSRPLTRLVFTSGRGREPACWSVRPRSTPGGSDDRRAA
jgi:predicted Zn-dependent protease with MMP-like domain